MAIFNGTTPDGKPLLGVVYSREYEGFADREKFPWLLEIAIEMQETMANGMPTRDELETINAFEATLVAAVSDVAAVHKVARVTGSGIRKVFCYLADQKRANTMLSVMRMTKQLRTFRYGVTNDATWARARQLGLP